MQVVAVRACVAVLSLASVGFFAASPTAADESSIIQQVDAAAYSRYEHVLEFTVTEHYQVFRGKDESHPAAEMTVQTTYQKGLGKTYKVLSQSGSEIIQRFGLQPLLDNEKALNEPGKVQRSWFTSANYRMQLQPALRRTLDGRDCRALVLSPKRKAPNMVEGTLWVDAADDSIVEIDGMASRSPSVFAGPTKMMRHYVNINGYAMATHARAESNSMLFGKTVLTIDYAGYQIRSLPAR